MDQIQPYLDYFAAHPDWAVAVVFLIAFGEALLVIGLFVPSTAVLVGAGTLVGVGKLPFWPVMIATTVGCILGDQLSYWAGRFFGDRLKTMWPLRNYPHLLAKGEEYVKQHGGKSIAFGRFVPGVKAVVPGIAGMFGMSQPFFLVVNITSGIAWAVLHLMPGVVLGQALALAGELSGKLLIVLLVLLVLLGIAGWLIRLVAASLSPYRKAVQGRVANWARGSTSKTIRRLGLAVAPENPRSVLLLLLIVLAIAALITLVDLVTGLIIRNAVSNFDQSLFNFFSELRSTPGDEIFVRITMLGDEVVLLPMAAIPVIWFIVQRNWKALLATLAAYVAAKVVLLGFSFGVSTPAIDAPRFGFKFPSAHAVEATTVFGVISVLTARGFGRWSQALIVSGFALGIIAIAFSRLYLGVNWFSDVLGGILIGGILTVLYSVATATFNLGRFKPAQLLLASLAVLFVAGGVNITNSYDKKAERYHALDKVVTLSESDYLLSGWSKMPLQRIDLVGSPKEVFVLQWAGSLESLQSALQRAGFKMWDKWTWRDALPYLNTGAALADLAPRPAVHDGLKAKITATLDEVQQPQHRAVLRVYQSNVRVKSGDNAERVYLVNLNDETLKTNMGMFAVPSDSMLVSAEQDRIIKQLLADPAVETLAQNAISGQRVVILRPKS